MELKEQLGKVPITPMMHLASYDVVSMFTNITFEQVQISLEKRYANKTIDTQLPMTDMINMLRFICVHNTEIKFDNKIYKQIRGLRMGSPVSPILARIVMDDLLDKAFTQIEKPILVAKYVDDILTIARPEHLDRLLTTLNSINPEIQFEMELENPQTESINYLELTIINKHDTTIQTKWYNKEISSNRIINNHSQHIPHQINTTYRNYKNNMVKLTDDPYLQEI